MTFDEFCETHDVKDEERITLARYWAMIRANKAMEIGGKPPDLPPSAELNCYVVKVVRMKESHRDTYWVILDRSDRPKDAKPWDKGRITPFMHEEKEFADMEATKWAEFLGVTVTT